MKLYNKKGISFVSTIMLLIMLGIFYNVFPVDNILRNLSEREIFMVVIYFLIALATEDYLGVGDLTERIWSIKNNGDSDDEKILYIKSFLEVNVAQWDKYWNMYEEVVNGKSIRGSKIKYYVFKIPKGVVNLKQLVWIIAYMIYNIFKVELSVVIPIIGLDYLIDWMFLVFVAYVSGTIVHLSKFMHNMFDAIKPSSEKNVKQSLSLLESNIVFGASQYGFLKGRIDVKEKLKETIKKGKTNGKK